jgi:lauroyl/myristoyl acyltransferase
MRQASRARWGIETLVVGEDAFAFIEVIKRLQDGGTVALLMDRPPKRTEVTVELFGRPFGASIAPAELARASGCSILPVYIAYGNKGYQAVGLPAVDYDRRALGKRDARVELTQRIIQALAPAIREHADQWYHFTPIWKKSL